MMTLHKLTAGTGYEYFTRNIAAMDSTEKGHLSLADYYSLKGEKPGHWVGSGLAGIDGLQVGDVADRLAEDPQWGPYLASRSELVRDLAAQVRESSGTTEHRWQEALSADLFPELVAQILVWRAAMGVPADDLSPTGPTQVPGSAARWQRVLDDHVGLSSPTLRHWTAVARQLAPQLRDDPQTPVLAAKLASLAHEGEDMPELLKSAMRRGPLPDDHAAAALLYRLERRPRQEPIREVWETVEFTESMGQRHERMRPPGMDRPHGYGIGI